MKNITDIHTHGIGGYETRGATAETILSIATIHGAQGVSAIIPTIYPAAIEKMRADMEAVKKAMSRQAEEARRKRSNIASGLPTRVSRILGVHLEGPFLNPARCGSLNKKAFLEPTMRNLQELIDGFGDIIRIITIAPELRGAPRLIKAMRDLGIAVSMGHSDATYREAETGFHAGATAITHIFNAMRAIHHREPGLAGFGLLNKEVYVEMIADPFHLDTEVIRLVFAIKDQNKVLIVSDSVRDTGTPTGQNSLRDRGGRLIGGSMTIANAARRLISMGFKEKVIMDCISINPIQYLKIGL